MMIVAYFNNHLSFCWFTVFSSSLMTSSVSVNVFFKNNQCPVVLDLHRYRRVSMILMNERSVSSRRREAEVPTERKWKWLRPLTLIHQKRSVTFHHVSAPTWRTEGDSPSHVSSHVTATFSASVRTWKPVTSFSVRSREAAAGRTNTCLRIR